MPLPWDILQTQSTVAVTGKNVAYHHITDEQLLDGLKASGSPPAMQAEVSEMFFFQREFGCACTVAQGSAMGAHCNNRQTTATGTSSRVTSTSRARRRRGGSSSSRQTGRRCSTSGFTCKKPPFHPIGLYMRRKQIIVHKYQYVRGVACWPIELGSGNGGKTVLQHASRGSSMRRSTEDDEWSRRGLDRGSSIASSSRTPAARHRPRYPTSRCPGGRGILGRMAFAVDRPLGGARNARGSSTGIAVVMAR